MRNFAFAIPLIFAVVVLSMTAQTAHADPVQEIRTKSELRQIHDNGLVVHTFGMPEYVYDGTKWVDRVINNNGTHFNVYSEMGSFSFDKSDCTITQYAKGFNPITQQAQRSDIVIGEWFWTIARKPGVNPWQVVDASMFACSITTHQNATGKYLTMTRNHAASGSYLKVVLAAPNDKPVEDFNEFYMNIPGWSGDKFAFVLWAKDVNTNTIRYRNDTSVTIPQGLTTIDRSQLTVDSLSFYKNGNPFYFDWSKAQPDFKSLILNKTGTRLDVQFGFNNNPATLSTGQKMFMDPTYGYTAGTHKSPFSLGGACTTNNGGDAAGLVGSDSGGAGFCYYNSVEWNINTIPNNIMVVDTRIRYDIGSVTGAPNCNAVNLGTNQPSARTNAQVQADIIAGSVLSAITCNSVANDFIVDLGTAADSQIITNLPLDFFAVGFIRNPNGISGVNLANMDTTELQVSYLTASYAVTTLSSDETGDVYVDLTWSDPNPTGNTDGYQINYTTPWGAPMTVITNNTGTTTTTYTVTGLTQLTDYSFRVQPWVNGIGGNASGNILNVTTLAFVPANFTIGFFDINVTNPDIFPIRFERTEPNASATTIKVIYPNTANLDCDVDFQLAQQTYSYSSIAGHTYDSDQDYEDFVFLDSSNDIINIDCIDTNTNDTGNYVLAQEGEFVLLEMIRGFRNGDYGTQGMFGALDLITLVVVIASMIGFNRVNESVGVVFNTFLIGALAWFEIITFPTIMFGALFMIAILVYLTTRKD